MVKPKPLTREFNKEDWILARDAVELVCQVTGARIIAKSALRLGLANQRIRSCARAVYFEADIGPIRPKSKRIESFTIMNKVQKNGSYIHLGPGFWVNAQGKSRPYYHWRRNIFAQIYPSTELVRPAESAEFYLKPGSRWVAYDVSFLRNDVGRLLSRIKNRNMAGDLGEPKNVGSKPRYDWSLIEPLRESARRGELHIINVDIGRGKRPLQAAVEFKILSIIDCSEAQARRKARDLVTIHEAVLKSRETQARPDEQE